MKKRMTETEKKIVSGEEEEEGGGQSVSHRADKHFPLMLCNMHCL